MTMKIENLLLMLDQVDDSRRWSLKTQRGVAQKLMKEEVQDLRQTLLQVKYSFLTKRYKSIIHVGECQRFTINKKIKVEHLLRCKSKTHSQCECSSTI